MCVVLYVRMYHTVFIPFKILDLPMAVTTPVLPPMALHRCPCPVPHRGPLLPIVLCCASTLGPRRKPSAKGFFGPTCHAILPAASWQQKVEEAGRAQRLWAEPMVGREEGSDSLTLWGPYMAYGL